MGGRNPHIGATVPLPSSAGAAGPGAAGTSGDPGSPAATDSSTGPAGAADVNGAQDALARFLHAYAGDDVNGVAANADQGALAMAGIVLDAEAINRSRGATTTVDIGALSFSEGSGSTAGAVILQGSVTLTTTISGSQGSGRYSDTVSGPVTVRAESGSWKVTDFTYDGRTVQYWPSHAGETVNGLHVAVGYVVSYGSVTAALVTLAQTAGDVNVQLQSCSLESGGAGASGTGDFTGPPEPTGVLRFSRIGATPSALVLRFGAPSGQTDDFDLALS